MSRTEATAGLFVAAFITAKMVGLESVRVGLFPFELKIVAALLPLAMIFGRYAILGITAGCAGAHTLNFQSFSDVFLAGFAAFTGSVLSHRFFRRHPNSAGLFAGTLMITAVWTLAFGAHLAYVNSTPLLQTLASTASTFWMGVNVVGYAVAEMLRQLTPVGKRGETLIGLQESDRN